MTMLFALDEDLLALLHDSFHDAPEEFQLTHLRVVCGSVNEAPPPPPSAEEARMW